MTKPKPIYSTDPEALKRANPQFLTEAQRNYRQMLIEQAAAKMAGSRADSRYLSDLADVLKKEAEAQLPPEERQPKAGTIDVDALDLFDDRKPTNKKDAFA
jgi:hypothetical protein